MNSLHVARFTVAYWCVFMAVLLPLVCAGLAKSGGFGKPRREGGYDNHDPRAWMARQSDWHARANAAQANSFEALPFFMGAVIVAHQLGAGQTLLDILAFLFIMLRIFYIMMYVSDMPKARSAVWGAAFLVNVAIFFIGYR
ncbi:MAPEG family protein [Acidovorax carolinensis]|uniref:Glutathione metabolism protein n=1 Tax=Acidovorax carolinensis TaxID=553814 RepID=A0A240TT45_9BURK|nr:MAPEG family protein [Acidovorax carolinensis]ART48799.1 glutathione metabolism protein [Acidovorax carolinensis]ART52332.1 glutathione metabolism protein [Acidovorax carolinensis]ART54724.1 glutathione metabolism protein [Acidovorax carolinensis]